MSTAKQLDVTVYEDAVTGTWTFTLHGHHIEIERTHGFLKIDGTLHATPIVQGLQDIQELAGKPLEHITHLLTSHAGPPVPQYQDQQGPTEPAKTPAKERTPKRPRPARPSTPAKPLTEGEERTVLPTEQAAEYLGLSPKTLETLRTRGGGPPFLKLGRRVVYRKTDLDNWLAARVRRSTSDHGQQ